MIFHNEDALSLSASLEHDKEAIVLTPSHSAPMYARPTELIAYRERCSYLGHLQRRSSSLHLIAL